MLVTFNKSKFHTKTKTRINFYIIYPLSDNRNNIFIHVQSELIEIIEQIEGRFGY